MSRSLAARLARVSLPALASVATLSAVARAEGVGRTAANSPRWWRVVECTSKDTVAGGRTRTLTLDLGTDATKSKALAVRGAITWLGYFTSEGDYIHAGAIDFDGTLKSVPLHTLFEEGVESFDFEAAKGRLTSASEGDAHDVDFHAAHLLLRSGGVVEIGVRGAEDAAFLAETGGQEPTFTCEIRNRNLLESLSKEELKP